MQVYGFLEKAQLENVSADLSNTLLGLIWYNTTDNKAKIYDGAVRALVTEDGAQTLTNKIFSGGTITGATISGGALSGIDINLGVASDSNKLVLSQDTRVNLEALTREAGSLYYVTDENKYVGDDGLNLIDIGSGSGTGINYTANPDLETNANDHTAYKDSASEVPDDGVGGSPTLTVSRSTVSPLVGKASAVISKPASNVQGEGINVASEDFDEADKGKIHIMSFEYDAADANYNDGDIRVYFKDETNGVVYRVNGEDVKGGKGTHYARVQVPINCDNGSLLLHVAATHADAFSFKYDRISVGPQKISTGTIVTDYKDYTPTGTPANATRTVSKYKRIGDTAYINIKWNTTAGFGTSNSDDVLPPGLSIDVEKLIATQTGERGRFPVGKWHFADLGSNAYTGVLEYREDTDAFTMRSGVGTTIPSPGSDTVTFQIELPIQGWSSQSIASEDFGGRDIYLRASGNNQTLNSGSQFLTYTATEFDTVAGFDGTEFTVPETGYYLMIMRAESDSTTADFTWIGKLTIDGVANERFFDHRNKMWDSDNARMTGKGSMVKYLQKGQLLRTQMEVGGTVGMNAAEWSIIKLGSSQQILETEEVILIADTDSGQNFSNAATQQIVWDNATKDTHNMLNVSNGNITVPYSGTYTVKDVAQLTSLSNDTGRVIRYVQVNGSTVASNEYTIQRGGLRTSFPIEAEINVVKGDVISTDLYQDNGGGRALQTSSLVNRISVRRGK